MDTISDQRDGWFYYTLVASYLATYICLSLRGLLCSARLQAKKAFLAQHPSYIP